MPKAKSSVKAVVARTPEELAKALGLSRADAKEWQVRFALLKRLKTIVRRSRLTHAAIASRADTSRTRVTAILNDQLDHVSTDLLIRILAALGYSVHVTISRVKLAA